MMRHLRSRVMESHVPTYLLVLEPSTVVAIITVMISLTNKAMFAALQLLHFTFMDSSSPQLFGVSPLTMSPFVVIVPVSLATLD